MGVGAAQVGLGFDLSPLGYDVAVGSVAFVGIGLGLAALLSTANESESRRSRVLLCVASPICGLTTAGLRCMRESVVGR